MLFLYLISIDTLIAAEPSLNNFSLENVSLENFTENVEDEINSNLTSSSLVDFEIIINEDSYGNDTIQVSGNLREKSGMSKFEYTGELEKKIVENGYFYEGPLEGYIIKDNNKKFSLLGLLYDPELNEATVTLTIGKLGEDFEGIYFFGEISNDLKERIDTYSSKTYIDAIQNHTLSNNLVNNIEGPYTFLGQTQTGLMIDEEDLGFGGRFVTDILHATDWFLLDEGQENKKVRGRMFTNTSLVEEYIDEVIGIENFSTASVTKVLFDVSGSVNIDINDQRVYPQEDVVEHSGWIIKFLANGTPLDKPITILSNFISIESRNIEHNFNSNSTGNVNQYEIIFNKNFGKELDYDGRLERGTRTYDLEGGLTVHLPFYIYPTESILGTSIYLDQSVTYGVSALPYYHGYVRSSTSWLRVPFR